MPDILYKGTISLSVLSLEDDGGHFEKETLGFKARENSKNVSYLIMYVSNCYHFYTVEEV